MSSQPFHTTVTSIAATTALVVAGTAAVAIGTSYRHVTVEVDGITHGVSDFFATASDVLCSAGVAAGDHDLVAPASNQTIASGDTTVVRIVAEYDIAVGSSQTTAWSAASSISDALSALPVPTMSMAADRSYTRTEMPTIEAGQAVHTIADSTMTDTVVPSDEGMAMILEEAGASTGPIDRVTLEHNGSETTLRIVRVIRGTVSSTTKIPYKAEGREDTEAEEGTGKTVQESVVGSKVTEIYQEAADGDVTVSAVLSTAHAEPTKHIVSKGTKAKRTEDTPSNSSTSFGSSDTSSSGPSTSAPVTASGDDVTIWTAIVQCESGGSPSISMDNGCCGMHRFSLPT